MPSKVTSLALGGGGIPDDGGTTDLVAVVDEGAVLVDAESVVVGKVVVGKVDGDDVPAEGISALLHPARVSATVTSTTSVRMPPFDAISPASAARPTRYACKYTQLADVGPLTTTNSGRRPYSSRAAQPGLAKAPARRVPGRLDHVTVSRADREILEAARRRHARHRPGGPAIAKHARRIAWPPVRDSNTRNAAHHARERTGPSVDNFVSELVPCGMAGRGCFGVPAQLGMVGQCIPLGGRGR